MQSIIDRALALLGSECSADSFEIMAAMVALQAL